MDRPRWKLCAAAAWVFMVGALAACDGDAPGAGTGVAGIDKFDRQGPEPVRRMSAGGFTFFVGPDDRTKPGLTWGNGTNATPGIYADTLERVASFGTQVVASNSTQTGSGRQIADGATALRQRFDVSRDFCIAGHSQGGSGTVNAARILSERGDIAVRCSIPVQPDTRFTASANGRDLRGIAIILCGSADTLAPCNGTQSNGNGLFNQSNVPTSQITVTGAGHLGDGSPVGVDAGLYPALVTAAIEAVVGGDPEARAAMLGPNPGAARGRGLQGVRSKGF